MSAACWGEPRRCTLQLPWLSTKCFTWCISTKESHHHRWSFVFLCVSLPPCFVCSPLQGCEVFGQAHGPGHGQEGESHYTVCYGDGQISRLCQDSLWNLQARVWCKGTLAPVLHHLIPDKLNRSHRVIEPASNWKKKRGIQRHDSCIPPTPPPTHPTQTLSSVAHKVKKMQAEYRQWEEGRGRGKCVFLSSSIMQQSATGRRKI